MSPYIYGSANQALSELTLAQVSAEHVTDRTAVGSDFSFLILLRLQVCLYFGGAFSVV